MKNVEKHKKRIANILAHDLSKYSCDGDCDKCWVNPEICTDVDGIERWLMDGKVDDHDIEYYKHEYYAECDRAERLEMALDKACEELADHFEGFTLDTCDVDEKRYFTKEAWKEWLMKTEM